MILRFVGLAYFFLVLFAFSITSDLQAQNLNTKQAFKNFSNRVVQVRVVEKSSKGKASIGSGFYVGEDGLLVSNYHVVSSHVFNPEQYDLDVISGDGKKSEVNLIFVDVVHDLALLKVKDVSPSYFSEYNTEINYGEKIFSIGNPQDLGFTIVEGIYNGTVKNSRLQKLNFSGSLNPGMSGGAAFDSFGKIVGVNVSTAGNQLSFLVPAKYVLEMFESYKQNPGIEGDFIAQATEQIHIDQQDKFNSIPVEVEKVNLKKFSVPGKLLNSLKCWSKSEDKKEERYSYLNHVCSSSESIFLNSNMKVGSLYLYYLLVENQGMNSFSFSAKIQKILSSYARGFGGFEEDFENFSCKKNFVDTGSIFWVNICTRKYKKLKGLYDLVLIGSSVDSSEQSLIFYTSATAISSENVKRFSKKILKNIKNENSN